MVKGKVMSSKPTICNMCLYLTKKRERERERESKIQQSPLRFIKTTPPKFFTKDTPLEVSINVTNKSTLDFSNEIFIKIKNLDYGQNHTPLP